MHLFALKYFCLNILKWEFISFVLKTQRPQDGIIWEECVFKLQTSTWAYFYIEF